MKKLTLDLDALAVESFQPAEQFVDVRGTVAGQASRTLGGVTACYTYCSCPPTPLI